MKQLLYKEFRLIIHPLYYLVLLLGGLILIPSWVYFVALSYVFFIVISNVFAMAKANNDNSFSVTLPVRKRDIVKARVISISTFELLYIAVSAVFGAINILIFKGENALLEPNAAFFGFGLIMNGIFNLIFFPMYYKSSDKIGIPCMTATLGALVFATGVEFSCQQVFWLKHVMDSISADTVGWRLGILALGGVLFFLMTAVAYRISVRRFERIDL